MSKLPTILVTGATGQQGGATAHALLGRGVPLKALVRDRHKASAQAIGKLGAELIEGDLESPDTLTAALKGVDGVFLITSGSPEITLEQEVRQAVNLIEASKIAKVNHFVFTSFIGTFDATDISFLDSKRRIEKYLHESQLPATILRPGTFMENFSNMWLKGETLYAALRPTSTMTVISAKDIGEFAAIALTNPREFIGRTMNIAVEILSPLQVADTFSRVLEKQITFKEQPLEQVRQYSEGLARMFERLRDVPSKVIAEQVDLDALRRLNPDYWTLEKWAERTLKTAKAAA
jgi:uncharacterized protein YbjT (DUF2867 family)